MGQLDERDERMIGLPVSTNCTLEGEKHMELEIQRIEDEDFGDYRREGYVTIACGKDREHLETVARLIKVRSGKYFRESIKLDHVDENGDITDVEYLIDGDRGGN